MRRLVPAAVVFVVAFATARPLGAQTTRALR